MKKIFLSFLAVLAFGYSAQAQMTIIPKVGFTSSNVSFENTQSGQKSTGGFLVGAALNMPLDADGFFSIQPELLYIRKGYGVKYSSSLGYIESNSHINYLEIPVLAKISFGGEVLKGYVNAGPSLAYGLGGTIKNSIVGSNGGGLYGNGNIYFGDRPANASWSDTYYNNRIDFGLQFGGGVSCKLGPGAVLLDLRYGMGLTNLNSSTSNQSDNSNKSQNRVLAISVGYAIPLGGK